MAALIATQSGRNGQRSVSSKPSHRTANPDSACVPRLPRAPVSLIETYLSQGSSLGTLLGERSPSDLMHCLSRCCACSFHPSQGGGPDSGLGPRGTIAEAQMSPRRPTSHALHTRALPLLHPTGSGPGLRDNFPSLPFTGRKTEVQRIQDRFYQWGKKEGLAQGKGTWRLVLFLLSHQSWSWSPWFRCPLLLCVTDLSPDIGGICMTVPICSDTRTCQAHRELPSPTLIPLGARGLFPRVERQRFRRG